MGEKAAGAIDRVVVARMNELAQTEMDSASADDVPTVIRAIQTAYNNEWEKQKLEFAREFLSRTWAGIPLPVLSVCGHGTQVAGRMR